MPEIEVVEQDILKSRCQAITSSANVSLLGGGGVSGAILRAGGKRMHEELEVVSPAQFGAVVVTRGHDTGFDYVLHAVADPDYLPVGTYAIYAAVLAAAQRLRVRSLALPAFGAGVFKYPPESADVAAQAVIAAGNLTTLERIEFCILDRQVAERYREALAAVTG